MTQNRLVITVAAITALLLLLHFFSAVFVYGSSQSRALDVPAMNTPDKALPYNVEKWLQVVALWALPEPKESDAGATTLDSALQQFDNAQLGDTTVALLAIYRTKQAVAVLALQTQGQSVRYVRLKQSESDNDISVSHINPRDVTITRGEQQVSLRLFTPDVAYARQ